MIRFLFASALLASAGSATAQDLAPYSVRHGFSGERLTQFTVDGTTTLRYDYDAGGSLVGVEIGDAGSVSTEGRDGVPDRFALHSAHPNPFALRTRFTLDVPSPAEVQVRVYDILGRHVETLHDELTLAGSHAVSWRPAGAVAGTYFVEMRAGGRVRVESVVLVR